jgi:MGT family glycosyltransferase
MSEFLNRSPRLSRPCGSPADWTLTQPRDCTATCASFQRSAGAADRDHIQPLRPTAQRPVPTDRLPGWVARRRDVPLVYMTLGTNTNSNMSVFRSVIDGLSDLDVDLLLTIGFSKDRELIGSLPASAHVENYVPQSLLLPRCSVVLCHAGAGTTLCSLALGLPLLALPQGADQFVMAELLQATGAGLVLEPAELNPARIREGVLALLHNPVYRAAAGRLQHEIAAMPGPNEAVPPIEDVVRRSTTLGGAQVQPVRAATHSRATMPWAAWNARTVGRPGGGG